MPQSTRRSRAPLSLCERISVGEHGSIQRRAVCTCQGARLREQHAWPVRNRAETLHRSRKAHTHCERRACDIAPSTPCRAQKKKKTARPPRTHKKKKRHCEAFRLFNKALEASPVQPSDGTRKETHWHTIMRARDGNTQAKRLASAPTRNPPSRLPGPVFTEMERGWLHIQKGKTKES